MDRKCLAPNCNVTPSFGKIGTKKREYCKKHKPDGYEEVASAKCQDQHCKVNATFGYVGENGDKIRLRCAEHKDDWMTDVVSTVCVKCKQTLASYGTSSRVHCVKCKDDDDVHLAGRKCLGCKNCPTQASFGFRGETATRCLEHILEGMENVISDKCKECEEDGYLHQAHWGNKNEGKKTHCKKHKKPGMEDKVHKKCQDCELFYVNSYSQYKPYCESCYIFRNPTTTIARRAQFKEKKVLEYIFEKFPKTQYSWLSNNIIPNGCSQRRPDLLLDLGYQVIIIEVDEFQHKTYDTECENKRVMEMYQDLNFRPVVLIRFNPDAYENHSGKRVPSCWADKKNMIKKKQINEWSARLQTLSNTIEYWLQENTTKSLEIVKLYFDGY